MLSFNSKDCIWSSVHRKGGGGWGQEIYVCTPGCSTEKLKRIHKALLSRKVIVNGEKRGLRGLHVFASARLGHQPVIQP